MHKGVVVLLLLLMAALPAAAQSCNVSATPMLFPAYNAFSGTASQTTSTVTVTCTGLLFIGVTYEARLGPGHSGNILSRAMAHSSRPDTLGYQVRLNSHSGPVWGNGTQGSVFTGTMLLGVFSRTHTRTVYGQVPAGQQVHSGSYADAPVMTIIY
jgi:spore coat protein U-like protein